jgi:2-enoate reductase
MADEIIQKEKADIVYMGRQLIVDPETANKYFNGKLDDIKHCIGCQISCGGICVLNPYDRHNNKELVATTAPKKVVILGGGIAGMEAARILTLRGHKVELYEKSDKLGGLIPVVAAEYKKEEFMNIVTYLTTQLEKMNIPVHLNKELSKEEILAKNPDVIAFAIGTEDTIPVKFEGKQNVITQEEAIMKTKPIGKNVVIWGLDTYWRGGVETAITLREQGYNIMALAGKEKAVAGILLGMNRLTGRLTWIYRYIKDNKVRVIPQAKLEDVTDETVLITDSDGKEYNIEADTLVYCGSRFSKRKTIEKQFDGVDPIVEFLGDCKQPRDIQAAIKDAHDFARNL